MQWTDFGQYLTADDRTLDPSEITIAITGLRFVRDYQSFGLILELSNPVVSGLCKRQLRTDRFEVPAVRRKIHDCP